MRMFMRRLTRLTTACLEKIENHAHMVARYTTWYDFAWRHQTCRGSAAMAATFGA